MSVISALARNSLRISLLCTLCAGAVRAQTLTMVSGNGQVVATQAVSNGPMVIQAKDSFGVPAPNVAITWAITQGSGTITGASTTTDANGLASANFLSTSLQPGASFLPATVTASSSYGTVNFIITTVLAPLLQPSVSIELDFPTLDNPNLTAASGSTLPRAVVVSVSASAGAFAGFAIPNVGVQVIDASNPSAPVPASCAAPSGIALTDNHGIASCDLLVSGAPGTVQLRASVGNVQTTRAFGLTITPGQSCAYSLSPLSQSFGASGGTGNVNVVATSGCGWSATSNANFVTIAPPAGGINNGSVSYTVTANSGPGRAGTLIIAGQTYTVNQTGGTPGSLTVPAQTLPS
ncbi:MAG TPA: Ig-like domain-containing protein, partial [Bryobacteraceae bacterium]|nr:Ig-like domain-containing protein [Bryobacteraceae bacterium]